MKHKIFELAYPEHLQKTVPDGYYMKTINRAVLETVDVGFDDDEFDSIEDATNYIKENSTKFQNSNLVVLPIIKVDFEGKVM